MKTHILIEQLSKLHPNTEISSLDGMGCPVVRVNVWAVEWSLGYGGAVALVACNKMSTAVAAVEEKFNTGNSIRKVAPLDVFFETGIAHDDSHFTHIADYAWEE